MCGALPSRIARRSTGSASPSISRKTTPGASVRIGAPVLRAMRWTTRYENSLSSSTPAMTSITSVTAEAMSATRSAHQKPSTLMRSSVMASAARSIKASTTRIARKPKTSVSGSRIAAMIGGRIALSAAITAATRSAAKKPLMWAPGTIHAATSNPIAEKNHVRTMWSGLNRRRSSRHAVSDAGPTEGSAVAGGTSSVGGTLIEWRLCAPGRLGVGAATRGGGSRGGGHSLSVVLALDRVEPLAAARLHLRRLLLRVGVRVLDELRAAAPAEDDADQHDREDDVERRRDELLAERVGGGGRRARVALERERVERLVDAEAARCEGEQVRELVRAENAHHRPEGDRDRVRREEDDDDEHLGDVPADLREQDEAGVRAEVAEDRGALLRLLPHPLDPPPEDPQEKHDQEESGGDDPEHEHRVIGDRVALVAEPEVERALDLDEEVQVDQRPDHHVEDLLDEVAGENPRERRAANDRDVHHERDERADVGGEEVVERDSRRVRREHGHVRHAARVRVAENPVPAECGEGRLQCLEDAAEQDVDDRDVGEGVPELGDPAPHVDAGQVEQHEQQHEAEDPGDDLDDPTPLGGLDERDRGLGHGQSLRRSQLRLGCDVVPALLVGGRNDDRAEECHAERRDRDDGVPRRVSVETLQQHERAEHHAHDRVRDRDGRHRRDELPRRERELLEQEPDDPGGRPDPELEARDDLRQTVRVEMLDDRLHHRRRQAVEHPGNRPEHRRPRRP